MQGIAIYDKEIAPSGEIIYRHYRPLVVNEIENISLIINYVESVLNTLNVEYGFTHNEVFWDKKESFSLVESNTRMAGGGITDAYLNCYGYTPLHSFLELAKGKKSIVNAPIKRIGYSLCMHIYNFFVDKPASINLEGINSFQSIISFYQDKKAPIDFKKYTRADHIAATLLLNNNNFDRLNDDIKEIKRREQSGELFVN